MFAQRYRLILFNLLESEQNVRNTALRCIQNIQPGEKTGEDFSLCFLLTHLIISNEEHCKASYGH